MDHGSEASEFEPQMEVPFLVTDEGLYRPPGFLDSLFSKKKVFSWQKPVLGEG